MSSEFPVAAGEKARAVHCRSPSSREDSKVLRSVRDRMNPYSSSPEILNRSISLQVRKLDAAAAESDPHGRENGAGRDSESTQLQIERVDTDRKVSQTIAYMLQHLNKHLQVASLAALVNVSPSHFFALFKRQTGCAPIDFFIRLRMQHACQLLDGTSLNVKEVAGVLGYDDPFYFSRTFKAVNRVPPREYRLMPREMKDAVRNAALPLAFRRTHSAVVPGSSPAEGGSPDRSRREARLDRIRS